jgi:DNA-binding Lrp family transcriptional regulator
MAYISIDADIGAEEKVLKALEEIQEVKESYLVYGVYDIITRIETETTEELKDTVKTKIRRLDNIRSTLTMIVV